MATFYTDSGSFNSLTVSGSTTLSASRGIALQVKSSGSTIFSVSGSGGEIFNISDVGSSTALFTVASGSTNILNVDNTKAVSVSGSLVVTGSAYIRGLGTTAQTSVVTIDTSTGQLYTTASSAVGGGGSSAPLSYIATGSVTASVNVGSGNVFNVTSASTNLLNVSPTGGQINGSWTLTTSGKLLIQSSTSGLQPLLELKNTLSPTGYWSLNVSESGDFAIRDNNTPSVTAIYIKSGSGAVGIAGITNPNANLHVSGTFRVTGGTGRGQLAVNSDDSVQVGPGGSSSGNARFLVYGGTSNGTSDIWFGYNATYNASIAVNNPGELIINPVSRSVFMISGAEVARINNSGSLLIGTTTGNYKLLVSGSEISGSLNIDNILYVSASNVGIGISNPTGALHVAIGGGTEFQVQSTGTRIGNAITDTHTVSGSFNISGSTYLGGNVTGTGSSFEYFISSSGGVSGSSFRITPSATALNESLTFKFGPYNVEVNKETTNTASFHIGGRNTGLSFLGSQPYMTGVPLFIWGAGSTGPNNISRMLMGVNTTAEYTNGPTYPSGSSNYFYINTVFSSPNPANIERRPLYIGAKEIGLFVGGPNVSESFSRTPEMFISASGEVTINTVLTLPYQNPLPSGKPTGSIATSGSGATFVGLFLYNGTSWVKLSV